MENRTNGPLRILRMRDITGKLGLGRSAIYDRLDPKSPRYDPTFPKPFTLGDGRAVGFIEGEVDSWLSLQISKSRKSAPE